MSSNKVQQWLCSHCEHVWEQGPPKPYRCPNCQALGIMRAYGRIAAPVHWSAPKPLSLTDRDSPGDGIIGEEPANEADVMLFVAELKKHALNHYEENGWDILVEAYTDEEVAHEIRGCATFAQALATMQEILELKDEHRREVRSTAW